MPGARHWYIPDAYLSSTGHGEQWPSHEAVCVLNRDEKEVQLTFRFYYEDRDPIGDVTVSLAGQRCQHIRLDKPGHLNGVVLPKDVPYAIELSASHDVIVQYSRLDVTQPNFTLMTTIPFFDSASTKEA